GRGMKPTPGWRNFEWLSGEWRLCLACNRWVGDHAIVNLFRVISRLGDGVAWYALMLGIALFAGASGTAAALHMAVTGVIAAGFYPDSADIFTKTHTGSKECPCPSANVIAKSTSTNSSNWSASRGRVAVRS